MIGDTISHYKITTKLGAGGMGEVYLAEDTKLDRHVALKFLPESLAADMEACERLIREAKAASRLSHPNIMTVHAVEEVDGRIFMVMEYVSGHPLGSDPTGADLPVDRIIDFSIQIADGLAKAHALGVVHRDIKPSNILIDADGRARILDFGLAQLEGAAKLTQTGSTLGTVAYTSPEQASGREADHRSDIFSLGTVLYELITGHRPFAGDHEAAIIYAIANEEPQPLARYDAKAPAELQRIVSKCLQKDPARRYQSAADLAADLRTLEADSGPITGGATQIKRPPIWQGVAAMAIIAVLAVTAFYVIGSREKPAAIDQERPMLAILPFENLGSAEDEYFADGITEEITTHVAKVSGLGVISRTSSIKYKDTEKSLKQIGEELGVHYVLEGTIRWDQSNNPARVRINPQLIRVSDDTHLWAETYDRELDHIFATQTDIARQVVSALNVTLLAREDAALDTKPTSNLKAYELYLRAKEIRAADFSPIDARRAIELHEQAVALDSSFALCYADLSQVYSLLHFMGVQDRSGLLDKSEAALQRALQLDPDLPEALLAAGILAYRKNRDYEAALEHFQRALSLRPGFVDAMTWNAATYRRQGKFAMAIEQYEEARTLDPLYSWVYHELGWTYMRTRQYDEALAAYDRSIELAPDQQLDYHGRAKVHVLKDGNLEAAKSSMSALPDVVGPHLEQMRFDLALYARNYSAILGLLDRSDNTVLFDQHSYTLQSVYRGYALSLMGDSDQAREAFETARAELVKALADNPDDHRIHGTLGVVYARLGKPGDAVASATHGIALFPISKDAIIGPSRIENRAEVYTVLGEHDSAIDDLEYLLSIPYTISPAKLRIDPRWDPLRDNARFQTLIKKGDKVF